MATRDLSTSLRLTSQNAAKLVSRLTQYEYNIAKGVLAGNAADLVLDEALQILLEELLKAIEIGSKEFNYPGLKDGLIKAFSNPAIIHFEPDRVKILANEIAGDSGDLAMGIAAARAELGLGYLSADKAAEFWEHRIYRPAREGLKRPRRFKKNLSYYKDRVVRTGKPGRPKSRKPFDYQLYGLEKYKRTMEARLNAWANKAPYWIWLNYGNHAGEGGKPYPQSGPTHFVEKAEQRILVIFEAAMVEVSQQLAEAITAEIQDFLLNPENYQPGQHLATIETSAGKFDIGVTRTGRVGVRSIS